MKIHTPGESYLWLKALWNHRQNSRMTRRQLEAAQLEKFRRLVSWVQSRSPFYRAIIHDLKINPLTCVPTDFPILTKNDVIENFDDIVTDRGITRQRIADFLSRSTDPQELFEGDNPIFQDDSIDDGGAAMTAWSRMQFTEMRDLERVAIQAALLKYCELDTLSMVWLLEYWRSLLSRT